ERAGVQPDAIEQVADAAQAMLRIFDGDPPDNAVDLVSFCEQQLGQIRTVLARNSRNEGSFALHAGFGESPILTEIGNHGFARPSSIQISPCWRSRVVRKLAPSGARLKPWVTTCKPRSRMVWRRFVRLSTD